MSYKVEPLFDVSVEHGEGPLWDPQTNQYYWVDLIKGEYTRGNLETGECHTFGIGEPLGVMALSENGDPVMATANGFGIYNETTQKYSLFEPSPEQNNTETRFNDGTVDPKGRFLAGTMLYDGSEPVGNFYRLNADQSFLELDQKMNIPNGMGFSPDGNTFFLVDTLQYKMWAYDYDLETGALSNKRAHMTFGKDELADGMTIDKAGHFWIAFYGAGKVVQYNENGNKLKEIAVPAPYTTSCCFGGKNMNQLFITTSRLVMNEEQIREFPLSGRCFEIEVDDVIGVADPRVHLN